MDTEQLIAYIRHLLRISDSEYPNTEIEGLIDDCKADLASVGVLKVEETDDLIRRAVSLYVKANFGFDNADAARLQNLYKGIKAHLSSSIDYAYYKITIEAGEQLAVTFDGIERQTNDSGQVVFYSKPKNHVKYTVAGGIYYADITGDIVIVVGG